MALSAATITYDLSDYGLADFDSRRTKVWATNNVSGPVVDTEGNLIHLGSANGTVNADGTGSITVPTPGTGSNPASWQTTIHVDYPDRNADRGRGRLTLGPFTITASGDLADLVDEQAIPPDFSGSGFIAEVEAIRDEQIDISNISTSDGVVEALVKNTGGVGPLTSTALLTTYAATFTPEKYGAVGDGVTDDSTAVQAAFTAAGNATGILANARVVLSQTYRITKNLYAFGTTTFEGDGVLVLDADLALSDGVAYWINMGVKSKGGVASTWVGRWSANLRATANARVERMLNVHKASDFTITRCTIDLTALVAGSLTYPGGGIAGYNNGAWCASPSRTRGWVTENILRASQTAALGSEGIGFGDGMTHIWVTDNYVHGFGDDAIALHAVDHFTVRGNRCFTPDGRILLQSCRWGTVSENHAERIANPDASYASGGALIETNLNGSTSPACIGVTISRNRLVLPAGIATATYMMRLQGGLRDSAVVDNELHSDTANAASGISIEAQTLAGWSDATALDPSTTARVHKLRVAGNYSTGTNPTTCVEGTVNVVGPVTYEGNLFASYTVFNAGSIFHPSNRVVGGSPNGLAAVHGQCTPSAPLLFEGDFGATSTIQKVKRNTVDRWYPRRKCIITAVEVETAADVTAGYFVFGLKKNGAAAATGDNIAIDNTTPRGTRVNYYNATNNRATAVTDYFELQAQGVGITPDPTQCRVRVFGFYTEPA